MNGFTPGPWQLIGRDKDYVVPASCPFGEGGPNHLALVTTYYADRSGESAANARLIATAPILLQELRGANTQMEMAAECIEAGRYDEALLHVRSMSRSRRAAIAEATGEQL